MLLGCDGGRAEERSSQFWGFQTLCNSLLTIPNSSQHRPSQLASSHHSPQLRIDACLLWSSRPRLLERGGGDGICRNSRLQLPCCLRLPAFSALAAYSQVTTGPWRAQFYTGVPGLGAFGPKPVTPVTPDRPSAGKPHFSGFPARPTPQIYGSRTGCTTLPMRVTVVRRRDS